MSLVTILIGLVILGLVLYLINMLPLDGVIKNLIHVVVILFIIVWLLQGFGVFGSFETFRIR